MLSTAFLSGFYTMISSLLMQKINPLMLDFLRRYHSNWPPHQLISEKIIWINPSDGFMQFLFVFAQVAEAFPLDPFSQPFPGHQQPADGVGAPAAAMLSKAPKWLRKPCGANFAVSFSAIYWSQFLIHVGSKCLIYFLPNLIVLSVNFFKLLGVFTNNFGLNLDKFESHLFLVDNVV